MATDDLYNSKQEMDSDDMEDEEYMKKGDLAAALVHSGGEICLSVIEVKEFQFGINKVSHMTAALDDLGDISKSIKVIGQIIALEPSTTKADFWKWTWEYISVHTTNDQLTHQQYAVEIPSFFLSTLLHHLLWTNLQMAVLQITNAILFGNSQMWIFKMCLILYGIHLNLLQTGLLGMHIFYSQ